MTFPEKCLKICTLDSSNSIEHKSQLNITGLQNNIEEHFYDMDLPKSTKLFYFLYK